MALVTVTVDIPAGAIWVSPAGGGDGSSEGSPTTLANANANVAAGGTVVMKGGNYSTQLRPTASPANESQRITYVAAPGEQPVITSGGGNAISLLNRSYITINGIDCDGGTAPSDTNPPAGATWDIQVLFDNTHHCILQNGSFTKADNFLIHMIGNSTFNKILDNFVDRAGHVNQEHGECINIRYGHHNLVQGNTVRHGGHNLINNTPRDNQQVTTVEFTDNNVFRNNDLDNDWSDVVGTPAGAGYRCGSFMEAKFCVLEGNLIRGVGVSAISNDPVGFKVEGEQHIVRRNFMWDTVARGFTQTVRVPETPMSFNSRIYHNSLHSIGHGVGGAAISLSINSGTPPASDTANNHYKNNAFFDCDQPEINVNPGGTNNNGCQFLNNAFGPSTSLAASLNIDGSLRANGAFSGAVDDNIAEADFGWDESNNPTTAAGFTPGAGSPLINAGAFLTTTVGTGSNSTTMVVADAKYFFDGFGISGLLGDEIQLEGQSVTSRITAVNYSTNTLTLATPLTWTSGLGVSLPYSGSAPDIGAIQT